jgi:hypothetical protein
MVWKRFPAEGFITVFDIFASTGMPLKFQELNGRLGWILRS